MPLIAATVRPFPLHSLPRAVLPPCSPRPIVVGVVGVLVVSLGSRPLTFGVLVAVVGPLVGSPRVAGVEVTELAVFAGVLAVALAGVLATRLSVGHVCAWRFGSHRFSVSESLRLC